MNISARQDNVNTEMTEDADILTSIWTEYKDMRSEKHPSQKCYQHDCPVVDRSLLDSRLMRTLNNARKENFTQKIAVHTMKIKACVAKTKSH